MAISSDTTASFGGETWRTGDVTLAAWLSLRGLPPRVVPCEHDPARAEFEFSLTESLRQAVAEYESGAARTHPLLFENQRQQLISLAKSLSRRAQREGGAK